ncbi:DUF89-domain-containing protein [Clavulina sp. PMI_390]|nr:DUF89-domain-containing protein [Clavulina sp. PMI_390]
MSEMESKKSELLSDATEARQKLHVLFDEMIQMCLWGNATDLSLLPTMSYADIQKLQSLQSVGSSQSSEGSAFILRNDLEAAWKRVSSLKKEDSRVSKIDIVLDNSGFELFTDLVLADFLVTYTPFVSKVVFHPKLIPWFVSDVLPPDFRFILSPTPPETLAPTWTEFFSSESGEASAPSAGHDLETMLARWRSYVADGTFALSVPFDSPIGVPGKDASEAVKDAAFWTGWKSYWALPEQDGLMKPLKESGLVIFKGDLNYRKLTADVKWPPTTPVPEALGPLSGTCSLLSLRTCKADVVVGLEPGTAERLDASEDDSVRKWRINGKYAVITYDGA